MKSLHELFVELETWLAHFRKHTEAPAPAAQAPAPASAPVEVAPQPSTDNPILDAYRHSNPAYVDPGTGNGPAENNRPDPGQFIDYLQWPVGGFDMIGKAPRVLQNVNASLEVVFDVRPSTVLPYTATVNGVSKTATTPEELKINATGPTINISVDQPDNARVVMSYNRI